MSPRLAQVLARAFKIAPESLTPDSGPHSIAAWDSAGHMNLIAELEKEFGIQFTYDEVIELVSAEAIAEALARHGAAA